MFYIILSYKRFVKFSIHIITSLYQYIFLFKMHPIL